MDWLGQGKLAYQPGNGQRLEAVKNTNFFRDEGGGELFILSHSDMAPR